MKTGDVGYFTDEVIYSDLGWLDENRGCWILYRGGNHIHIRQNKRTHKGEKTISLLI